MSRRESIGIVRDGVGSETSSVDGEVPEPNVPIPSDILIDEEVTAATSGTAADVSSPPAAASTSNGDHDSAQQEGDAARRALSYEEGQDSGMDVTPHPTLPGGTADNAEVLHVVNSEEASEAAAAAAEAEAKAAAAEEKEHIKDELWKSKKKHIFILTSAGKPVFTRWGDESDFAELFGVLQILCSMVESSTNVATGAQGKDVLRRVTIGSNQAMYFLTEGELQYVMVTKTRESPANCVRQLQLMHHQLLAVLPTVSSVLKRSPSYDVRRMFNHGDINVMKTLIRRLNNEPGFMFRCLQPLGLPLDLRDEVNYLLRNCNGGESHLWTLLLYGSHVVSFVAPEEHQLHADDILLVINFAQVVSNSQGEVWAPICLPRFNTSGYLWAFAARVEEIQTHLRRSRNAHTGPPSEGSPTGAGTTGGGKSGAPRNGGGSGGARGASPRQGQPQRKLVLVQLATTQEAFPSLRQSAQDAVSALTEEGVDLVDQIEQCASTTPIPIDLNVLGPCCADLQFFMFISSSSQLVTSQLPVHLVNSKTERKAMLRQLLRIRDVTLRSKAKEPLMIYGTAVSTIALALAPLSGNVGGANHKNTELYMVFLPTVKHETIPTSVAAILKWLKAIESKSFLTQAVHW